jgi:hypothetical protein
MAERPDAFEKIRLLLARRRALGDSFEIAWQLALDAIPPAEPNGRVLSTAEVGHNAALAALANTVEAWRAGFERRAPPPPAYPSAAITTALIGADRVGRRAA